MNNRLLYIIRDLFLFSVLLILVNVAFKQNISFLRAHQHSIIHELDRKFINQLSDAHKQLHCIKQHVEYTDAFLQEIVSLQTKLDFIEEQYKKNSPGLILLGPIGTTSIVIKEKQLQEKLLKIINSTGKLLYQMHNHQEQFISYTSIASGLAENRKLLKTLRKL